LADRHDLGSCAERREGSSPSFPTLLPHMQELFGTRIHHFRRSNVSILPKRWIFFI
jgi:hypothetical protein